jgi:hypothetical protein
MEYVRLGNTGLKVSRLALGCMSYGDPATPNAHPWALTENSAWPFFQQAVELGVTFWDTANVYQHGTSEEIVGRAISRYSLPRGDRARDELYGGRCTTAPEEGLAQGNPRTGRGGDGLARTTSTCQIHCFDPETLSRRRWRHCTTS